MKLPRLLGHASWVSSPQRGFNVTTDQPIGDKGMNVPSISVGVSQTFLVNAKGIWAYQISKAKEQDLARLIVGETVDSARMTLEAQKGVGKVNIQVNGTILPSHPEQIEFVLQPVAGFRDNGPTISLTPTVTDAGGVSGPQAPGQPLQQGFLKRNYITDLVHHQEDASSLQSVFIMMSFCSGKTRSNSG